jgi:hypothetical protein
MTLSKQAPENQDLAIVGVLATYSRDRAGELGDHASCRRIGQATGTCSRKGDLHLSEVRIAGYTGTKHDIPRYSCRRGQLDTGEPSCIAFGGLRVDDAIAAALLQVVEPGAIAAAVAAEAEAVDRQDQVRAAFLRDLEAARYAADRAWRQYDAADPANRLVADELETRWNTALGRVADVEAKIIAHDATIPARTQKTPSSFAGLAANLEAVWFAPIAERLKKRIIRTVIQEVVADVDDSAAEIILFVHWMGGIHTQIRLPRRRRGQRNSTSPDIIAAVRLLARIANDDLIAGILNRNKLLTGHGNRWTRERVTALRSHHRIPVWRLAADGVEPWLNLTRAAKLLGISQKTLRLAVESGEIDAAHPLADGPRIFSRSDLEAPAAQTIVKRARGADTPRDLVPNSKPSSLQPHRQMGVVTMDCRSRDSGRSICTASRRTARPYANAIEFHNRLPDL